MCARIIARHPEEGPGAGGRPADQPLGALLLTLLLSLQEVMSAQQKGKPKMAEESSSGSSGSPSPGDTLPWNLPKHQRTKRTKSASGNGTVLDPAERAVIRIAGKGLVCGDGDTLGCLTQGGW